MMKIEYPFRKGSTADKFCELSDIDWKTGYSKIVCLAELELNNLGFGNGGSWCRSDGPLGKIFNINRVKKNNKIIAVKLEGFNKNTRSQKISKGIRDHFHKKMCVVLNINSHFMEIDHKDGRKDNSFVDERQDIEDFQPFHKTVNIAKRDHCKRCIETNLRFDATNLGYSCSQWIGGQEYVGSCVGCYWFDPFKFNQEVSKKYIKMK